MLCSRMSRMTAGIVVSLAKAHHQAALGQHLRMIFALKSRSSSQRIA